MLKRKISVSIIAMFTLILMFSITAMANVTNIQTTVLNGKITVTWDADTSGKTVESYTINAIKDGVIAKTQTVTDLTGDLKAELTVPAGTYDIEVKTKYDDATTATITATNPVEVYAASLAYQSSSLDDKGTVTVKWTKDSDPTAEYTVVVTNVTADPVKTVTTSAVQNDSTDATGKTAFITFDGLTSAKYEVEVKTSKGQNTDTSFTLNVFTPASNPVDTLIVSDKDNGIMNANQTGLGAEGDTFSATVIKSVNMVKNDKTVGNHRTHGEYQNNTNSCASCHQTHTGASKSLLFKDGVYNTCTACHDGTLGFYNVFEHSNAGTFGGDNAGNMSVHLADGSVQVKAAPGGNLSANSGAWVNEFNCASCHSPHGSYSDRLLHYNPNGMGQKAPADGGIGVVGAAIYDVVQKTNDAGDLLYIQDDKSEGTTVTSKKVWDTSDIPTANKDVPRILVRAEAAYFGIPTNEAPADATVIRVYDYTAGKYGAPDSYKVNTSPWLYGYAYASPNKNYYTRFFETPAVTQKENASNQPLYYVLETDGTIKIVDKKPVETTTTTTALAYADHKLDKDGYPLYKQADGKEGKTITGNPIINIFAITTAVDGTKHYKYVVDNHDEDWNANLHIEWSKGYIYAKDTTLDNLTTGDVARAYTVDLALTEIGRYGDANGVPIYKSDVNALYNGTLQNQGIAMSTYCASCHTDYLAHSGDLSGKWDQAYRHSTDSDSYTCVRCHFAHGTDVTVMMDANEKMVKDLWATDGSKTFTTEADAKAYMLDQNPSSALKRYTNMSVCWGCHTDSKAEQLKNTDSYGDDNDPHGLNEQPVVAGKITSPEPVLPTPPAPDVTRDDVSNVMVAGTDVVTTTLEYRESTSQTWLAFDGAATFVGAKTVYVRVKGVPTVSAPGNVTTLTFTVNQ